MSSIADLLAQRNSRLIGATGDSEAALARRELTKYIGEHYPAFNQVRLYMKNWAPKGARLKASRDGNNMARALVDADMLETGGDGVLAYADNEAESYLQGGWLEELAFCAMHASGADEILFSQHLAWEVENIPQTQKNEVDVIARRGDVLSFTSCKTCHPIYSIDRGHQQELRNWLFEADYWDNHFADGKGRAVLMVTKDLIDEAGHELRTPTLFARAMVLDVDVVSLDYFKWDTLVERFARHWNPEPDFIGM